MSKYDAPASKPVAPYLGGKRNLASTICPIIDAHEHTTYAEPFIGMGGIFLRRKLRPRAEVINDYNREVSTLFRILQRHYPQLLEVMRFQITTRAEFQRLLKTDPDTLTDLERAARFLYLQRTCFAGKVGSTSFGVSADRSARFNLTTLEPLLEDLHTRLSGVTIECLDYAEFITRYDKPGTLFYLDPPYWGSESDYGKGMFERSDFEKMAAQLRAIKGAFILSINDRPEVRDIFAGFKMQAVKTTYSAAQKSAQKDRPELLVFGGA